MQASRLHRCDHSQWHYAFLLTAPASQARHLACRDAHAIQQEAAPTDRKAWQGGLSLRTRGNTPGESAKGHAGEGPGVTAVHYGTLKRLDRQAHRQLHERDHDTNGTLTDPQVQSFGSLDTSHLDDAGRPPRCCLGVQSRGCVQVLTTACSRSVGEPSACLA